jgi:hypothetical protein
VFRRKLSKAVGNFIFEGKQPPCFWIDVLMGYGGLRVAAPGALVALLEFAKRGGFEIAVSLNGESQCSAHFLKLRERKIAELKLQCHDPT